MTSVPCNGCTRCCHYSLIPLDPQRDDIASYETIKVAGQHVLKHRPEGGCVYLGDGGCTIHDRAPVVCREFDCRRFYRAISREERKAATGIKKQVLEAGRDRVTWGPTQGTT